MTSRLSQSAFGTSRAPASSGVAFRAMRTGDVDAAHALSTAVQWPHRAVDWMLALDLGEGFVGERDGAIVATAIRWRWGPDAATVGLIIVKPEMQGQRIGEKLMALLLGGLGDCSVQLYATREGRRLYERHGFSAVGQARQLQGLVAPAPLVELKRGVRLRPLGSRDTDRLVKLDSAATGMDRSALIEKLLQAGEAVVLDADSEARGFAVLRRFGRGHLIGPVVATDDDDARALIGHCVNLCAGKFVRIDIDASTDLAPWLEALGLQSAGEPIAMLRGPAPARSKSIRTFALASQAFG
jgi:GNAT superfamily N-acetyltransferase